MNQALREQIWAMAQQEGAEFYEGFAGSPNSIDFKEDEFWRFVSRVWQEAHDRGHDLGWDAGQAAAESQSAFEARNRERTNERIRELAEQAGSTHKQSLGVYQFYADELEKFAQLIVRECAEISKKYAGGSMPVSIALAIKEHFGVKA